MAGAVKLREGKGHTLNQLITMGFVKQPLALPGSANYIYRWSQSVLLCPNINVVPYFGHDNVSCA